MKKTVIMIMAVAIVLLTGCKTVYVPVEKVRTDTLMVAHIVTDSVWVDRYTHDSVYIHEKGDTVWYEKWHTRYVDRWRDRVVTDTVYKSRVDSVVVAVPQQQTERLTKWQRFRIKLANWLLWIGAALVVAVVGRFVWRMKGLP